MSRVLLMIAVVTAALAADASAGIRRANPVGATATGHGGCFSTARVSSRTSART